MAFSLKTVISELEKNIVPGILQENASNLSSYRRRLERLAGILKFQELLKLYPFPVNLVMNEKGFHSTDCVWLSGRGEVPPHDCAMHVLLESMVFQERMLHDEPTEARLEEILQGVKEYLPLAMHMTDENSVRWQTMYNYVKSGFPQHQGNSSRNVK
ncbi:uncharacterized protein TNCV_2560291 [Trichonephila clavipes]|uniref:Uncharacterized protein n=1 Tax=Trichonephila clavipes TaxID=2585209 RepID=A0A8X6UVY8_TRICX|nr:uncharacterized protein TNCV_2560291 [Trichonephila clavipes]